MNGTVTPILSRRELGKVRRASYWQNRADAAPDPKGRAAVAWDAFRARVRRYPQTEQDAIWRQLEVMFNGLAPDMGRPKIKEEVS